MDGRGTSVSRGDMDDCPALAAGTPRIMIAAHT